MGRRDVAPPPAPTVPDTFRAVTWNVYAGTPAKELQPIMARQRSHGVSLFLMQEAGGDDLTDLCQDNGLDTFIQYPQCRIAWDRDQWVLVRTRGVRLAEQPWFHKGGEVAVYSDAAEVILCDLAGRSLTVVSYHTPSHVQVPEKERPARRYAAMLESFATLGGMADDALTTGWLAGGDDNWDETTGLQTSDAQRVMLSSAATGLRQVQSPTGTTTHGKRQIDDFRVPVGGKLRVGEGWVSKGGGDHKLHGREFAWRA